MDQHPPPSSAMKPLLLLQPSTATPTTPPLFLPISNPPSFNRFSTPLPRFHSPPHRHYCYHFPLVRSCLPRYNYSSLPAAPQPQPPRTLFPGGYKRPEIKVPNIVLQLDPDDVLHHQQGGSSGYDDALDFVDKMVSKWVGIVVLNPGSGSGKRLYDAACLLKSVVRDRAYLLIGERVDIAAAINASGVLLSDQGLPAIVARNMMMDAKSEAVVLPLVARNVQTPTAAFNASSSEGADFLVYSVGQDRRFDLPMNSGFKDVKIPIFVAYGSGGETLSFVEASDFLKRGASGLVMSLEELKLFGDNALSQLFNTGSAEGETPHVELESNNNFRQLDVSVVPGKKRLAGFVKLEDEEKQLIETEKSVLLEAINALQRAAPLMKEVSLLIDAVSQIDEPFLLAIVGEFNSGKSTVINALLGKRYLKEGVIPTTNEITFLRYAEYNYEEQQRCERYPDGQYICYLPAPILRQMNIVDTPGTNVILQRQQRLTEEFVPRADLLLFVISADRPLTESEVAFLCYTQQWKKKIVFVLNKSDLYRNASELEEAISFIKENARKLLNAENVLLYPVSARSALEEKLSTFTDPERDEKGFPVSEPPHKISSFYELEKFLYSFLDGSTETGMERMKLKLETPIGIAERLLSSCQTLVKQDCQVAKQDLTFASQIVNSVKDYAIKMENKSISWRRKTLSLVNKTKSSLLELIEANLQLSNLDLVASYIFKGEKSATMPVTLRVQNDIIGPALSDAQNLLDEYVTWLRLNNTREGKLYKESFEKRWPSFISENTMHLETYELLQKIDDLSLGVIKNVNAVAASRLIGQEMRQVFLGTFGGLGAAGLSASLLTSVLPTTLEDLLALGLCSAGGYIAISNFPARRQEIVDKVNRAADSLAREVEEAMEKDLLETVGNLEDFVKVIGKPYQDAAQQRVDKLLTIQDELSDVEKKLRTLQIEIQNLHVS